MLAPYSSVLHSDTRASLGIELEGNVVSSALRGSPLAVSLRELSQAGCVALAARTALGKARRREWRAAEPLSARVAAGRALCTYPWTWTHRCGSGGWRAGGV